ncbi:MAG: WD40/YVTN/BNR-like repeat-containing protein, partial [Ktedonobacteraceae bacterium]
WQTLNNGLPGNSIVYAVQPASISAGAPNLIFAATNQGFYRSEDAGVHWAQSQQSLARTSVRSLFVDFRHPVTVYVGTGVGVLRSDDSGQNWSGIGPGLPRNQPVYALLLGASNYAQLYAATGDVYMFPGSSQFSITRLLPILFVVLLFYALYRLSRRNRRGKQNMLKPERIIEQPHQMEDPDRSTTGNLP